MLEVKDKVRKMKPVVCLRGVKEPRRVSCDRGGKRTGG